MGRKAGNEFVALFLFDQRGKLIEAKIDQFGPRRTMDDEKRRSAYEALSLGTTDHKWATSRNWKN